MDLFLGVFTSNVGSLGLFIFIGWICHCSVSKVPQPKMDYSIHIALIIIYSTRFDGLDNGEKWTFGEYICKSLPSGGTSGTRLINFCLYRLVISRFVSA